MLIGCPQFTTHPSSPSPKIEIVSRTSYRVEPCAICGFFTSDHKIDTKNEKESQLKLQTGYTQVKARDVGRYTGTFLMNWRGPESNEKTFYLYSSGLSPLTVLLSHFKTHLSRTVVVQPPSSLYRGPWLIGLAQGTSTVKGETVRLHLGVRSGEVRWSGDGDERERGFLVSLRIWFLNLDVITRN